MLEDNTQNNIISKEQVLEAIKNNLIKNNEITRDFEQEVYKEVKDDLLKLQELEEDE